jgi:hypothetical protein
MEDFKGTIEPLDTYSRIGIGLGLVNVFEPCVGVRDGCIVRAVVMRINVRVFNVLSVGVVSCSVLFVSSFIMCVTKLLGALSVDDKSSRVVVFSIHV